MYIYIYIFFFIFITVSKSEDGRKTEEKENEPVQRLEPLRIALGKFCVDQFLSEQKIRSKRRLIDPKMDPRTHEKLQQLERDISGERKRLKRKANSIFSIYGL